MNASAMPLVGAVSVSPVFFSLFSAGSGDFSVFGVVLPSTENRSENFDKSLKNFKICSEFFKEPINGFTLSGKFGFCER